MKAKLLLSAAAIAILAAGCNFKSEGAWQKDKSGDHSMCMVTESKLVSDEKDAAKKAIVGKCQFYSDGKVVEFIQRPALIPTAPFAVGSTILMTKDGQVK
jgi:hypothetical protein